MLCTETVHFTFGTSEMCTVHRNRTHSIRHIRNVYCAQKQYTLQVVHQKCVLCTKTEYFPDGTHKAVYADHKTILSTKLTDIQSLKYTNICNLLILKVINKLNTGGKILCFAFNLCYVQMLVLRKMADVVQVINNIKSGIYSSFLIPKN